MMTSAFSSASSAQARLSWFVICSEPSHFSSVLDAEAACCSDVLLSANFSFGMKMSSSLPSPHNLTKIKGY
jgi:hypothetical protein